MALRKVSDPSLEPVSLTEAKLHLRVTGSGEDALIAAMLTAARTACEERLGRSLLATRWVETHDGFPVCIRLHRSRLIQVNAIRYLDSAGVWQTLAPSAYAVDLDAEPPRIEPAYGETWPSTRDAPGAVSIDYTTGYAAPVVAVDAAADTVQLAPWRTLAVDDAVVLSTVGGLLPAPLVVGQTYYVQAVPSAGLYTLAASPGGGLIDLTTAGTSVLVGAVPAPLRSWIFLALGDLYENRERSFDKPVVPHGFVDSLLDTYRVMRI